MYYVYSTLGQDMVYTNFVRGGNDLPQPDREVFIRGGSGVIDNKTLITPLGIRTEITDQQHDVLKNNVVFQAHVKNGFIVVREDKQKAEKVARENMESRDDSAQMTGEDFKRLREKGTEGKMPAELAAKKAK